MPATAYPGVYPVNPNIYGFPKNKYLPGTSGPHLESNTFYNSDPNQNSINPPPIGSLYSNPNGAGTQAPGTGINVHIVNPAGAAIDPNAVSSLFGVNGIVNTGAAPKPNPNNDFTLLNQTKNPAIAGAAATTLGNENALQTATVKNFNDYLQEAKASLGAQAGDVAKDTSTLTTLPSQVGSQLGTINTNYENAANNATNQYANLNAANAKTIAGDVSQLGNLDQQYITNSENALAGGLNNATRAINARSINSSGSAGASSDYNQAVIGANADANLALQQNLSNMQIGQLQNYITPLQQSLYGQNVAQTQYAQQLQSQIAGMKTGSVEQVAAITQAVVGRPAQEQQALLSALNLPLAVQQQVMASLPGPLNALTSVDQANNFYGLSSPYSYAAPGYTSPPAGSAYSNPGTPYRAPGPLPNAGNVQSGTQAMGAVAPQATGVPGQYANLSPAQAAFAQNATTTNAQYLQAGFTYDPTTGRYLPPSYINKYGGVGNSPYGPPTSDEQQYGYNLDYNG